MILIQGVIIVDFALVTGSLDIRQILRKIVYGAIDRINRE